MTFLSRTDLDTSKKASPHMRISAAFPSKHLKAADLLGKRVRVVMQNVEMEKLGDENKPVLYFQGKEKGVVLNKTNSKTIAAAYGDDTNDWIGQPIELYEAQVEFQGNTVSGIRVSVPRVQAARQSQAPIQSAPAVAGYSDLDPPPHDAPAPAMNGRASHTPRVYAIDQEVPF